jgi:uncharacterized membrane protein/mono/diheme cytochrome c family protein
MANILKKVASWDIPILVFLHVFLAFLLLFESQLQIPYWVQPVGRMHPLLLHFPIVLVLVAALLPLIAARLTTDYAAEWRGLLFFGTVSALLVCIMGVFLSKEGGYEVSTTLVRHKWSGAGVAWLTTLLYLLSHSRHKPLLTGGYILTISCLLLAGHWGAALTHGEDFLTAPLRTQWLAQQQPDPEEALVYEDVIRPILEQKCVGCHQPNKMKGELLLTTPEGLQKGGKSGALWVAGKPESSLLMERLLLPLEAKEHMPPKEKPQLTSSEIALLSYWIKDKASFSKRLASLPAGDSLRILAEAHLGASVASEPLYDFDPAKPATVQRLQTDFRTVMPVARHQPALNVHYFSKTAFTPQHLEELKAIEQQVVFLNLSRMPVQDRDLATLKGFVHLEKLNLNFTEVDGTGLLQLDRLSRLNSLSLAGTKLSATTLESLLRYHKQLRTVAVWNTPVGTEDVQRLRRSFPAVTLLTENQEAAEAPLLRLNPPVLDRTSAVFTSSATVRLSHPVRGVTIRYTLDGTEPDSLLATMYDPQKPPIVSANTTVKARVFKEGWYGSEVALFDFYKSTHKPDSLRVLTPLSRVHQGLGKASFFDGILGGFNANSPAWANHWMGVRENDIALMNLFKKPIKVRAVGVRSLTETETGIFPPAELEIWGGTHEQSLRLLGKVRPQQPTSIAKPYMQYWESGFKEAEVSVLKIVVKPLKEIPAWHGAKGRPALLLVDEIFIN